VTNPETVHDFFKKNPHKCFCDDCVAKNTGVKRHQVNTIAATLALFPGNSGFVVGDDLGMRQSGDARS
jgi:hypothetical protein